MSFTTAPIVSREINEPIALLSGTLFSSSKLSDSAPHCFSELSGTITVGTFLSHVQALAKHLPEQPYAINLCDNRYMFTVAFCAALIRGQTNLLPPNNKPMTQTRLLERYKGSYILHDGKLTADLMHSETKAVDITTIPLSPLGSSQRKSIPHICLDHLAAISFTSGSTGDSQPNQKSWRTIIESSKMNAAYMLADYQQRTPQQQRTLYQLATVPAQHMWGLESSVFLPLFNTICASDAKPLFPQDIHDALQCLPLPRMLVTTPVHLRALCLSQIAFPSVTLILCATSPLSQELAQHAENCLDGELREVYGCSEMGSMAIRRAAYDPPWTLFANIQFSSREFANIEDSPLNNKRVVASAAYLPEKVILQDNIEILDDKHFRLQGRSTDMINIGGKRGSLLEINKVLMAFPGIIDGVIFVPKAQHAIDRLAALVVLPKGKNSQDVRNHLRQHLDNSFIPRILYTVDALPREDNGKLPQQQLQSFYRNYLSENYCHD